jgi:hypothetical protein
MGYLEIDERSYSIEFQLTKCSKLYLRTHLNSDTFSSIKITII